MEIFALFFHTNSAAGQKKSASLIEIETFGSRFRNWPLLGFAFRNNSGKVAQDRTNSNFSNVVSHKALIKGYLVDDQLPKIELVPLE